MILNADIDAIGRDALAHCVARVPAMDELLEALVRVPSGTNNLPGNRACLDVLAGGFEALGFRTTLLMAASDRPHMQAARRGEAGSPSVLLLGHSDTTFDEGHPFQGYWVDGGRAHGPGVATMKGGLVGMLATLDALNTLGFLDRLHVRVFLNTDHGQQSRTSRRTIRRQCRDSDLVLGFTSACPDGAAIVGRYGSGRYLFTTHGKAAHAGSAMDCGRNALVELASLIPKLESLNDSQRPVAVSCGVMNAGRRANVVPDIATLLVEARCARDEHIQWLDERMAEIAASGSSEGFKTTVKGGIARPPWPRGVAGEQLAGIWKRAARAVDVEDFGARVVPFACDSNFAHAEGIPVFDGLGPRGGDYHTSDEWIDMGSLPERAALASAALMLWRGTFQPTPEVRARKELARELQLVRAAREQAGQTGDES